MLGIIPNFDVNIKSAAALEPIFHVSKVKFHFNVARATTKRSNRTSRIKLYPTKYSTYLSKASIISRIWCIHSFHTCKLIQGSNQPNICDEVARSRYVSTYFCWASFYFSWSRRKTTRGMVKRLQTPERAKGSAGRGSGAGGGPTRAGRETPIAQHQGGRLGPRRREDRLLLRSGGHKIMVRYVCKPLGHRGFDQWPLKRRVFKLGLSILNDYSLYNTYHGRSCPGSI